VTARQKPKGEESMKLAAMTKMSSRWMVVAGAIALSLAAVTRADDDGDERLRLSSQTFQDHGLVPDVMASTIPNQAGTNSCTLDGLPGGNESPQLSWHNAPRETRTFTIVIYDETAGFTHWALYNIPRNVTSLPGNLTPDSTVGTQVFNDFFVPGYGGPCPPAGVVPTTHRYTVTVYALADRLDVVNLTNFPAFGESVYQALIKAARHGTVLESATLTVFDSTTPASNQGVRLSRWRRTASHSLSIA
jgi:Raf kinase inhibitor-like YbhB/YbcL family protein